jgi:hypothetical protein
MDKSIPKWLIRAGSLFLILGFFIPSVTVSCSALGATATQSFSLNDLAGAANSPLLYLVLVGALATLVVAFIPARDPSQKLYLLVGEFLGYALGALCILVVLITLREQIQQVGLDFDVGFGILILLMGYGMGAIGMALEFFQRDQPEAGGGTLIMRSPPVPVYSPPPMPPPRSGSGARLELMRGNAPRLAQIQPPDFLIGRSGQCHLRVSDPRVSGTHVRLRFAQGVWFIQDQNSSNGTFVNGKRINAQRLGNGDQIQIGDTTYIFRM